MSDIIPQDDTPLKRCPTCPKENQWHPATHEFFYSDKNSKDKLTCNCRVCIRTTWHIRHPPQPKEPILDGYKRCFVCKKLHPATLEWFYAKASGKYGVEGTCKQCRNQRTTSKYFYAKGQEIG